MRGRDDRFDPLLERKMFSMIFVTHTAAVGEISETAATSMHDVSVSQSPVMH